MLNRSLQRGFTLIEVMVTIAIIAILVGVAVPSYREYVRRGQLPEAFNSLSDIRVKLEQYYQDNRAYSTDGACGTGVLSLPSTGKYFQITCTSPAGGGYQTYTITATGVSGNAVGHVYTLNQNGVKGTTKYKNTTVAKACWMMTEEQCS